MKKETKENMMLTPVEVLITEDFGVDGTLNVRPLK